MGDDYVDEKIEQYERKLKQAEKAILERVHLMQLSVTHLERLARAAGEFDTVERSSTRHLPGLAATHEDSLRQLELRAAILGYGPNAGDDSPLPLVQPRAVAMRTRSL